MKNLGELFGIPVKSTVAIVGAGGKTTLMYNLAEHYRNAGHSVAVGTTTKIVMPPKDHFDHYLVDKPLPKSPERGIHIVGRNHPPTGKIDSLPIDELKIATTSFDYLLLEADGAKEMLIKGWAEYEPVVPDFARYTVGIINLDILGMPAVAGKTVHRFSEFSAITGCKPDEKITSEHLARIIQSKDGIFGKAKGKPLLFLNGCDTMKEMEKASVLVGMLDKSFASSLYKIIAGSAKGFYGSELMGEENEN